MHTAQRTTRQEAIELEYGKPLPEVLADLLRRYRNWGKVAKALEVDYATLMRWRRRMQSAHPEALAAVS